MRYLLIALIFCSCYNQRKATVQHGKAVATYPVIGADYCARVYPSKDSLIQGATIIRVDTLWEAGETFIDTIRIVGKPIEITKTIMLPGHTITIERLRVDTVRYENTAALDLARINERAAVAGWNAETTDRKKYQKTAKRYLLVLIGLGLLTGVWLFFKLRKPKK